MAGTLARSISVWLLAAPCITQVIAFKPQMSASFPRRLTLPLRDQSTLQQQARQVIYCSPTSRVSRYRPTMQLQKLSDDRFMVPPPEPVLKAVERAGGRVTVQDVASFAGVDIPTAQQGIVKLAALTQGDLEVSEDGDVVYSFPSNFRTVLRTNSLTQRAKEVWEKVWPSLFWLTRVSFGLCLILSLVLVFTTLAFGSASIQGGDRDDRDRRRSDFGGGGGISFYPNLFGPSPFDFFYYRPYNYYDRRRSDEMGFLESCFSYIFGDGNPNGGIEEERYQQIASMIRQNGGAVVAEQLAPYLDSPFPKNPSGALVSGGGPVDTIVDENFVLPVLTRLNGRPEVTPEGEIVYVFPDLMTSAVEIGTQDSNWSKSREVDRQITQYSQLSAEELVKFLRRNSISTANCYDKSDLLDRLRSYLQSAPGPKPGADRQQGASVYLEEQKAPFSRAPEGNRFFAGILGVINLAGALFLGSYLGNIETVYGASAMTGILALSRAVYGPLLLYAIGFNVIPFVRNGWLKRRNLEIEQRNESRRAWAGVLSRTFGPLYDKIMAARNYKQRVKYLKPGTASYSTKQTVAEQAAKREQDDFSDFDRRLRSGSGKGS